MLCACFSWFASARILRYTKTVYTPANPKISFFATLYTLTVLPLLGLMQEAVYEQGRNSLWPNCIVKYKYEACFLDNYADIINFLGTYMAYIEERTAVRFVMWREGDEGDYVTFDIGAQHPEKCGHTNGTYTINIMYEGTTAFHILRSLLRVLGFLEEQNFHNRDMYFSFRDPELVEELIARERTDPECASFFRKCPFYPPVPELYPNFESVMLNLDHRCNQMVPRGMIIPLDPGNRPMFSYRNPKCNRSYLHAHEVLLEIERIEVLYPLTECIKQRSNKGHNSVVL